MAEPSEAETKALAESKRLREAAYRAYAGGRAAPSQMAIVEAYPSVLMGFLSGLFNKQANAVQEIAFEARDRAEYQTTGTTAALKISRNADLADADRAFKGTHKGMPKRTM
ncbi:MAG: hypothetical protein K8R48_04925 [Alphaproteobacteria bacterium]|nr:hypothetical protein [Alphaproteobacteria bacterium]